MAKGILRLSNLRFVEILLITKRRNSHGFFKYKYIEEPENLKNNILNVSPSFAVCSLQCEETG
jgi:hypothetical protein